MRVKFMIGVGALTALLGLTACSQPTPALLAQPEGTFRVLPYVQNPSTDAMSVVWFSEQNAIGELEVEGVGRFYSQPQRAEALDYSQKEIDYIHSADNLGQIHANVSQGLAPSLPYRHVIRVQGLTANQRYIYHVKQAGNPTFSSNFKTAPERKLKQPIRFVVMSDMETEPESSGKFAPWSKSSLTDPMDSDPNTFKRPYLVDQSTGYQQTLTAAAALQPDLWLISGDLTAKGGRQLDWDEFWRHAAGQWGQLASSSVILPVMGNHDNYWHPDHAKSYNPHAVQRAYAKWNSYWELPSNGATQPSYEKRYYRIDYGPMTLISLDSSNGNDQVVAEDTNLLLDGQASGVPDFNVGSEQWQWAEQQLQDAYSKGQIIFVQWHHMAYGTGLHNFKSGWAGLAQAEDKHSGLPMRVYHPLMKKYAVMAVFSGHNEVLETVNVDGVQYWDVGFSGDGLRGSGDPSSRYRPLDALDPAIQRSHWSAHAHAPEQWQGKRLVAGGKHYGFLAVEIHPLSDKNAYHVSMQPHYSFPVLNEHGVFQDKFVMQKYAKKVDQIHLIQTQTK